MTVPLGQCELRANDGSAVLRCLLGAETPQPASGYGGFESVERPGRPPVTHWTGPDGLTLSVPLLLDDSVVSGSSTTPSVKVRQLEALAGLDADAPPPTVRITANLPRPAHEAREWVVSGLEWGEAVFTHWGALRRQEATVTLLAFGATGIERIRRADPFKRRELRKGETLRKFAKRVLGDARRWQDVAALNRDNPKCPTAPDYAVKAARLLKVPPREPVRRRTSKRK
jgi:hypothetical protein